MSVILVPISNTYYAKEQSRKELPKTPFLYSLKLGENMKKIQCRRQSRDGRMT